VLELLGEDPFFGKDPNEYENGRSIEALGMTVIKN
jgi:hypothetical protein